MINTETTFGDGLIWDSNQSELNSNYSSDSPILLFEGTYSQMFAGNPQITPRHDYNQILYRIDLDDPALTPDIPGKTEN